MALNFEDIKEQVIGSLRTGWEQFQESSVYQQGRDKYENLTPLIQKLVVFGAAALTILIFLSFPWSSFSTSSDSITRFEEKRSLIRDLLKVSREANDTPDIPIPPDVNSLKSRIEQSLVQAQLLPVQMKGVEVVADRSTLIPSTMATGSLRVTLAQLNLRQVIDLGYQIQALNPSVKMTAMSMVANALKPKYFDVVYTLVALNVPQAPAIIPEAEEPAKGDRKGKSPPSARPRSGRGSTDPNSDKKSAPTEDN